MKFYETHFEEYTSKAKTENLHPKLDKLFSKFPANLSNLKNIIFYNIIFILALNTFLCSPKVQFESFQRNIHSGTRSILLAARIQLFV